jgi:hypothetical protein
VITLADIRLPLVGPVSKKWVVIVAGGSVLTIGYIVIRKRKASAAAASSAASGTASDATGQIDPQTGDIAGSAQDQVDLAAMQSGGTYGTAGFGLGGSGGYVVSPPAAATIPGAGGFTTNGEWVQQAEQDLGGLGIDAVALSAALGKYLTARPLNAAEQSLVDQAIAAENYPPVAGPGGYPPAMHTTPTGPGGGTGGGPPPPGMVTVPRLISERVENANSALASLGLRSTFGPRKPHVPYYVTAQNPKPGAKVKPHSTVHLTIGTRP